MKKRIKKNLDMPVKCIYKIEYQMKDYSYEESPKTTVHNEIIYVDYGQMEITINNSTKLLSDGDFIVIPSKIQLEFTRKINNRAFSCLNIHFAGKPALSIVGNIYSLNTRERDILRTIKDEETDQAVNTDRVNLAFLNLLLLFIERRKAYPVVPAYNMRNRLRYKNEIVNNILDYLDKNYDSPLNSDIIATRHGISPTHMRRLIKEVTKMPLSQHLKKIRINIAQHLILESSKNINEISGKVGYNSFTHFCKIFKEETGVTPTQYANTIGRKEIP